MSYHHHIPWLVIAEFLELSAEIIEWLVEAEKEDPRFPNAFCGFWEKRKESHPHEHRPIHPRTLWSHDAYRKWEDLYSTHNHRRRRRH